MYAQTNVPEYTTAFHFNRNLCANPKMLSGDEDGDGNGVLAHFYSNSVFVWIFLS